MGAQTRLNNAIEDHRYIANMLTEVRTLRERKVHVEDQLRILQTSLQKSIAHADSEHKKYVLEMVEHGGTKARLERKYQENDKMRELLLEVLPQVKLEHKGRISDLCDPNGDSAWLTATQHHPNAPHEVIEHLRQYGCSALFSASIQSCRVADAI